LEQECKHKEEFANLRVDYEAKTKFLEERIEELSSQNTVLTEKLSKSTSDALASKKNLSDLENNLRLANEANKNIKEQLKNTAEKLENENEKLKAVILEKKVLEESVEEMKKILSSSQLKQKELADENLSHHEEIKILQLNLSETKDKLSIEKLNVGDMKAKHDGLLKSMFCMEENIRCIKDETEKVKTEKASIEKELKSLVDQIKNQAVEMENQKLQNNELNVQCLELRKEKSDFLNDLLATRKQLQKARKAGIFRRIFKRY